MLRISTLVFSINDICVNTDAFQSKQRDLKKRFFLYGSNYIEKKKRIFKLNIKNLHMDFINRALSNAA